MLKKDEKLKPIVKWAGGKRKLLSQIEPLLPEKIDTYYEPFLGGGALLFYLQPEKAVVSDINSELISMYKEVKAEPEAIIQELKTYEFNKEFYYWIRNLDRDKEKFNQLSPIQRASRFLYLNKCCFNGLHRLNSRGEFNVPISSAKNPDFINADGLLRASEYFNKADIDFQCGDFEDVLRDIEFKDNDFIYFDPPYDLEDTNGFVDYSDKGFTRNDQIRLREFCDKLNEQAVKFIVSNMLTNFIKSQYRQYEIVSVFTRHMINSKGSGRTVKNEILIKNFDLKI